LKKVSHFVLLGMDISEMCKNVEVSRLNVAISDFEHSRVTMKKMAQQA